VLKDIIVIESASNGEGMWNHLRLKLHTATCVDEEIDANMGERPPKEYVTAQMFCHYAALFCNTQIWAGD
jgi:hypothetical protein